MLINDAYVFEAGWLFFAAWSAIVAGVSLAAFGRDLIPSRAQIDATQKDRAPEGAQRGENRGR